MAESSASHLWQMLTQQSATRRELDAAAITATLIDRSCPANSLKHFCL
jgi:hypothetical protein